MKSEEKTKVKTIKTYLFYGWLAVVFILSAYDLKRAEMIDIYKYALHFFTYFFTALISYVYFYDFIKMKKLLSISAVLFACVYGVLMEFMQCFILYKSFSTDGIIADCVGAIMLGIIVIPKRSMTIYGRKI